MYIKHTHQCTRSQSVEVGSSQKRACQEFKAEAFSRWASRLKRSLNWSTHMIMTLMRMKNPMSTCVWGFITPEVLQWLRRNQRGLQRSRWQQAKLCQNWWLLHPTEAAPSTSQTGQEESIDPKNMQPGSPIVMMPSVGFPEQSPTVRLMGGRLLIAEVSPTLVSCSLSSEELDYSGDDIDWNNECPTPDTR